MPVQPGMDALIVNGHAAEREETDPAKKKKKKKKKSKTAGECFIDSNYCSGEATFITHTPALNSQL